MSDKFTEDLSVPQLFFIKVLIIHLILRISFDFWTSLTFGLLIAALFMYLRDIFIALKTINDNINKKKNE